MWTAAQGTDEVPLFHPLVPGKPLPDDWNHRPIPSNVEVGECENDVRQNA